MKSIVEFMVVHFVILHLTLVMGSANDGNSTGSEVLKKGIVRVLEPGVFDYQSEKFVIRMRAWGVNFPQRGKPGYQNAINFTEKQLLSINPNIKVKMTFDDKNLKVVDLRISSDGSSFSRLAIENGIGWHNEKETNRYGPFVIAQLKAKRNKEGLWSSGYDLPQDNDLNKPRPTLPGIYSQNPNYPIPQVRYWITSLGKVHRPGCSFYERGRGALSTIPKGVDCRICGGRKGK